MKKHSLILPLILLTLCASALSISLNLYFGSFVAIFLHKAQFLTAALFILGLIAFSFAMQWILWLIFRKKLILSLLWLWAPPVICSLLSLIFMLSIYYFL